VYRLHLRRALNTTDFKGSQKPVRVALQNVLWCTLTQLLYGRLFKVEGRVEPLTNLQTSLLSALGRDDALAGPHCALTYYTHHLACNVTADHARILRD
jgi:hypothetical protein